MKHASMSVDELKAVPGVRFRGRPRRQPGQMNKTEARMAAELEVLRLAGEILWWGYETHKLRLAEKTFITFDFAILHPDGSLELRDTKGGHTEDDARVKMKVAAAMYWFYRFTVYSTVKGGGWAVEEL